jgi:hypothetical protein
MTFGLIGLRDLFPPHALFSAHDVPRPKPDPADTSSGITAAVVPGMQAIGYTADSDEDALRSASAGAEIICSLEEIPELLIAGVVVRSRSGTAQSVGGPGDDEAQAAFVGGLRAQMPVARVPRAGGEVGFECGEGALLDAIGQAGPDGLGGA